MNSLLNKTLSTKKETDCSFRRLFSEISPNEFVTYFNKEYAQTLAFILSFCRSQDFVKKVLKLSCNKELKQLYPETCKRLKERRIPQDFIHTLEEYIDEEYELN
jgi:hypothetical protein